MKDISNTRLYRDYNFKYLGVLLDHTLSWKDHVEYIAFKISFRLGILRRAHKVLPLSNALQYYSLDIFRLLFTCLGQL